jgi:glycosyltransferase involved in cell wall biosynthesis
MSYPRVLVVSIGRINASDTANNGLLLRNLFGSWPRENLAQIYSSGDNGDDGFFGHYYQLRAKDRRMGSLFFQLKSRSQNESATEHAPLGVKHTSISLKTFSKRLLVDSGLYELIFRPRLSREMIEWVKDFQPGIILAQGYNLALTWLPMMLSENFRLPIAYYPTDDWPSDLYRNTRVRPQFITKWVRRLVEKSSCQLVKSSAVRIAFNPYMKETYDERYGVDFSLLMHGDDLNRFASVEPHRLAATGIFSIVCTGVFDHHRLPLLHDFEQACEKLTNRGLKVHAMVFPVNFPLSDPGTFKHLHFASCPSHNDLASILRGADILFLPERFDETAKDIRLCISSKAHLFMFSGRPTVVYSDPITGIARYARREEWAEVVDRQDTDLLAATIEGLINDAAARKRLSEKAFLVAQKNHDLNAIQSTFYELMSTATQHKKD